MSFLSPLGALVALAVVIPLGAYALLELRARRVSRKLTLTPPPLSSRLGVPIAIAAVAGLLALAAAQPVIAGSKTRVGRADAEVYTLFDISKSMTARLSSQSPTRLERAKQLAQQLRDSIPEIPVGIASLTDRMLPHVFPTLDGQVYASTLRDAIGIERPPPVGQGPLATDFNSLGAFSTNNYFKPGVAKRLVVVFTDGESRTFDDGVLNRSFRNGHVRVLVVHTWDAREHVYLIRNAEDPGYRPDAESIRNVERLAADGGGAVLGEDSSALDGAAKDYLGSGPSTRLREQRTRISLAPFVALAALIPLGFVLVRRNL
jgi:hypothetical protein